MAGSGSDTIGPSPIESIRLVRRFRIDGDGTRHGTSLPGHMFHFMVRGKVHRVCDGRTYALASPALIWYHECESLTLRVSERPVVFYSVNFTAPSLPPPAFEARVLRNLPHHLEAAFRQLVTAWSLADDPASRLFQSHSALLRILIALRPMHRLSTTVANECAPWWTIESAVKKDLAAPITRSRLLALSPLSATATDESCKRATGCSPIRRIKQVRMSYARGLVIYSELPLKEIAARVGYARINEFSRDFRKHFGRAPSLERSDAERSRSSFE
jgi:AraC-like DNA-binding protein